jgi:hypothetical protein
MKFIQPYDQPSNPTAPYVDLNEAMGVDGSVPPAKFFNNLQAEVLAVITAAGLTPSDGDLTQLLQAIIALMPSPSGGPSDASLVHWATDSGGVNNLIVTPSPVAAGLAAGFTIFLVPANTVTGNASITVNLSPSGSITKNIRRDDLADLAPGDIKAARLCCLVYDGTQFRLAWVYRGVVTDNITIGGNGIDDDLEIIVPYVRAMGIFRSGVLISSTGIAGFSTLTPGVYEVELTRPMPDTNYIVFGLQSSAGTAFMTPGSILIDGSVRERNTATRSVTRFQIVTNQLNYGFPQPITTDFQFMVVR